MKFPGMILLFIFVVIFIIVAGCNSAPPSKGTSSVPPGQQVTSTPETTVSQLATIQSPVSPVGTQVSLPAGTGIITDPAALTQLILLQTDFPSFVVSANSRFGPAEKMEQYPSIFNGYQKGHQLDVVLEKDESHVSQLVAIIDTRANASKTYDQLDSQFAPALQIQHPNVSLTANSVSIGDRGKMYVFKGISSQNKWLYYLFFTRGNVFEIITMEVPAQSSNDEKVIMDIAGNADRRITQQHVPTTSSTQYPY